MSETETKAALEAAEDRAIEGSITKTDLANYYEKWLEALIEKQAAELQLANAPRA